MQEINQEYLKSILNYNSKTGVFTWKERPINHFKSLQSMKSWNAKNYGKIAGTLSKSNGYVHININKNPRQSHRLAWLYIYGAFPINQIDHINNIRSDNRISNLREATNSQNSQNLKKARKNNKSTGLLGSYFFKKNGKYVSYIKINGKQKNLGYFNTPEQAHEAYIKAKRELHPFGTL